MITCIYHLFICYAGFQNFTQVEYGLKALGGEYGAMTFTCFTTSNTLLARNSPHKKISEILPLHSGIIVVLSNK